MSIKTCKVGVGITVKPEVISRIKDTSFVSSPFEITPNTLESSFMRSLWVEGVTRTLVDCERDIRTTVSTQVEEHSNGTGVIDYATSGGGVGITRQCGSFG